MQDTISILREALTKASHPVQGTLYDERETRSIIDLLLEEVCGITRVDRLLNPLLQPTPAQREELMRCAQLLAQGIPVQQALGYEWFCGQKFNVTPDVLIPRPETAELIEWIQTSVASDAPSPTSLRLLDMGTGSGCIAITLARLINNSQVLALDLSTAALNVAIRNAYEQHVDNVQFIQADILKCVDNAYFKSIINQLSTDYSQPNLIDNNQQLYSASQPFQAAYPPSTPPCAELINTTFDIIVSNPPYICQREAKEMSALVVEHEPSLALFVPDDDPLLFYRAIARFARQHLSPRGYLFFEINAAYGPDTCQMLRDEGFSHIDLRQDVNGRDRMVCASTNAHS